ADDRIGQLALWGHLEIVVANGVNQQALVDVARNDRRARVAALADALARIEEEAALDLLRGGGVALVAVLHEYGTDSLLAELDALRIGLFDRWQHCEQGRGGGEAHGVRSSSVACRALRGDGVQEGEGGEGGMGRTGFEPKWMLEDQVPRRQEHVGVCSICHSR